MAAILFPVTWVQTLLDIEINLHRVAPKILFFGLAKEAIFMS